MRNISIFTLFYKSLSSLKEIAKFRFLGIGKTIQYIFFLVVLSALPSMYEVLTGNEKLFANEWSGMAFDTGAKLIMIPVLLFSSFILYSMILFLKISILAGGGFLFAYIQKRKLPYRQSYRVTAFSITLPTVVFTILSLFNRQIPGALYIDAIVTMLILYSCIRYIPKPKK